MSQASIKQMKPFLSILIIISTLLLMVFCKMEVRRMGYLVLQENKAFKTLRDDVRMKVMTYAKVTRPTRVREFALSRLTMNDARSGQIIHLTGDRVAVTQ